MAVFRERSGTAGLSGRDLPVDETLAAYANLDARARLYKDCGAFPGERLDRLRAAAFLDILNGICADDRIACGHLGSDAAPEADPDDAPDGDGPGSGDGPRSGGGPGDARRPGASGPRRAPPTGPAWAGPTAPATSATAAARPPTTATSPTTTTPDDGLPRWRTG